MLLCVPVTHVSAESSFTVWLYHGLLIHSLLGGCLGSSLFRVIMHVSAVSSAQREEQPVFEDMNE